MGRDRAEGWKYAKKTGHQNENNVKNELLKNIEYQKKILSNLGIIDDIIIDIEESGISEKNVLSILGDTTKSKTDLKIKLKRNTATINISLKKSLAGQVYLIDVNRFINGFEKRFFKISENVKKAIVLFWGNDEKLVFDILNKYSTNINYEKRKKRLVAETLFKYDKVLYDELINFFREHIDKIVMFCFSLGLERDTLNTPEYIWYKNTIDNLIIEDSIDIIISISDICNRSKENKNIVSYGKLNGGTVINLPFGFVQWHQGKMQFHHKYNNIKLIGSVNKCQK